MLASVRLGTTHVRRDRGAVRMGTTHVRRDRGAVSIPADEAQKSAVHTYGVHTTHVSWGSDHIHNPLVQGRCVGPTTKPLPDCFSRRLRMYDLP